jgi:hypothetical protein
MKTILLVSFIIIASLQLFAQNENSKSIFTKPVPANYGSTEIYTQVQVVDILTY